MIKEIVTFIITYISHTKTLIFYGLLNTYICFFETYETRIKTHANLHQMLKN